MRFNLAAESLSSSFEFMARLFLEFAPESQTQNLSFSFAGFRRTFPDSKYPSGRAHV
jgi:hypothetical protein